MGQHLSVRLSQDIVLPEYPNEPFSKGWMTSSWQDDAYLAYILPLNDPLICREAGDVVPWTTYRNDTSWVTSLNKLIRSLAC